MEHIICILQVSHVDGSDVTSLSFVLLYKRQNSRWQESRAEAMCGGSAKRPTYSLCAAGKIMTKNCSSLRICYLDVVLNAHSTSRLMPLTPFPVLLRTQILSSCSVASILFTEDVSNAPVEYLTRNIDIVFPLHPDVGSRD